jgi:hypothetical protein
MNPVAPRTISIQNGTEKFHGTVNRKEEMAEIAEKGLIAGAVSTAGVIRTAGQRNAKI